MVPPPLVSVVMASFSRADLLESGLQSIMKQKPSFNFEVVVVNDGFEKDKTKKVCDTFKDSLRIKYVFSGQRNVKELVKRNPAIPNNIAIKQSSGEILILTCPEILHLNNTLEILVNVLLKDKKALVIPKEMYFDDVGDFTKKVQRKETRIPLQLLNRRSDHVEMPFLMGVWKEHVLKIGGYDEDFVGYASEDNDFVGRLLASKLHYVRTTARIVHLYHGERCTGVVTWNNPEWMYNYTLKKERKNIIVRNKNREWGSLKQDTMRVVNFKSENLQPIPKIAHLYWDKGPMSWLQTLTVKTFHRKNPDWEIRVYVPKEEYVRETRYIPDYVGIDYFEVVISLPYVKVVEIDFKDYNISTKLHHILRSDIFRYHLLYDIGGLWSDFDVLWLKSMDHFYKNIKGVGNVTTKTMGTFVCRYNLMDGLNNISVLMSRPKHPLYRYLIQVCNEKFRQYEEGVLNQRDLSPDGGLNHQVFGTVLLDDLFPTFSNVVRSFPDVLGLPYKTFFPYRITDMEELYKKKKFVNIDDSVMAIHWFNGHKLSKEFIHGEYKHKCTMRTVLDLIEQNLL